MNVNFVDRFRIKLKYQFHENPSEIFEKNLNISFMKILPIFSKENLNINFMKILPRFSKKNFNISFMKILPRFSKNLKYQFHENPSEIFEKLKISVSWKSFRDFRKNLNISFMKILPRFSKKLKYQFHENPSEIFERKLKYHFR